MENKTNLPDVPYLVHEDDMARLERTVKRLWILIIILIVSLIGTNGAWLYYESQWEVVENSTEVTQDVDATADGDSDLNLNTVGGDYYGSESESTPDSKDDK